MRTLILNESANCLTHLNFVILTWLIHYNLVYMSVEWSIVHIWDPPSQFTAYHPFYFEDITRKKFFLIIDFYYNMN